MKTGLSDAIASNETPEIVTKSVPTLSTITLRFVTLLAGVVVALTWIWSR